MHQVGLSRIAYLSFVMFQGEFVGLLDQGLVVVGPVGADFAQEIAKPCNRQNIGCDVLAQSRHVRLYDVLRTRLAGYKAVQNLCGPSSTGRAALQVDYLSGSVALKGHGFSHAVVSVESWASAPEGTRTSSQHRSPSVACMLTCMLTLVVKKDGAIGACYGEAVQWRGSQLAKAWALDWPPALFSIRPGRIGG